MIFNLRNVKMMAKCFVAYAVISFCNYTFAEQYRAPVTNPYKEQFHWSLPPDVRAIMALDSVTQKKLDACVGHANEAGHGAEDLYDEHYRNGVSMASLTEGFPRQKSVAGYKPAPTKTLDSWPEENSGDDITMVLSKRTLDLMWGYYKDYEQPAATSDKTSVAQQVMWDYCLSIPKELFAVDY